MLGFPEPLAHAAHVGNRLLIGHAVYGRPMLRTALNELLQKGRGVGFLPWTRPLLSDRLGHCLFRQARDYATAGGKKQIASSGSSPSETRL